MSLIAVPMTTEQQDELRYTIALQASWIIQATEKYGVGGPDVAGSLEFTLASQMILLRVGRLYVQLGAVPGDRAYSVKEITNLMLERRGAIPDDPTKKEGQVTS